MVMIVALVVSDSPDIAQATLAEIFFVAFPILLALFSRDESKEDTEGDDLGRLQGEDAKCWKRRLWLLGPVGECSGLLIRCIVNKK